MSIASTLDALQAALSPERVITDVAERAFFSQDVFRAGLICAAVVQPISAADVQAIARICSAARLPMIARGGGLSYTDAYLPAAPDAIMIDARGLNKIEEINVQDGYVIVQAGATWAALHQALAEKGVRTPYWGPLSGLQATVGGALAQGSIFLGSARYGAIGDSVLGIEVVRADGQVLRTGSWGADENTAPFMRYFGPDMTGIFIGDAGALGIKTRVCLRLIPAAKHCDFLSYETPDFAAMQSAMSAIASTGFASECFAFDPQLAAIRMQRAGLASDIKTLGSVVKSQGLLAGLKIVAGGRNFIDTTHYSLHLSVEAASAAELSANMQALRQMLSKLINSVKEIDNAIPKVLRSQPFTPPNTILGPAGQRWVPVHGIVPHSQAQAAFTALQAYFEANAAGFAECQASVGYLMATVAAQGFLIEPCFYWLDERAPFHQRMPEAAYLARIPEHPARPDAKAFIEKMKIGAAKILRDVGGGHFQLGKFYSYRENRNPAVLALFDAIKQNLDPHGLMNPGALR
jgi:FAD/FMN-containing dehydrogenase